MGDFIDAISADDRRRALEALRDKIAAKLDAGDCSYCGGPRGDASGMASLSLRLMKIFEALDALPYDRGVSRLDSLRSRSVRTPAAKDSERPAEYEKRRQGSRRTGESRGPTA